MSEGFEAPEGGYGIYTFDRNDVRIRRKFSVGLGTRMHVNCKAVFHREDRASEAAQYDFFPVTYALPMEYGVFVEDYKRQTVRPVSPDELQTCGYPPIGTSRLGQWGCFSLVSLPPPTPNQNQSGR